MDAAFVKWGAFLLSLSLLIVLHEAGHFISARTFKTRVSKFYLFFDFLFPVSNWLKFSLLKFKRGETEYGLGWFPLGGYVQIEGMVDEQMDTEKLNAPPQPWEFRAKPAWQRLIIMAGGIIVNVLLGFLIYIMILWYWGEQVLPASQLKYGIAAGSIAKQSGLQDGDRLLQLDQHPVTDINTLTKEIILYNAHSMQISRNGKIIDIPLPADLRKQLIHSKGKHFISPRIPAVTGSVEAGSAAALAGVQPGDRIVSVDGQATPYYHLLERYLDTHKGNTVQLGIERGQQPLQLALQIPAADASGLFPARLQEMLPYETRTYTFPQALQGGVRKGIGTLADYTQQMKLLFTGEIKLSEGLGGFGTLAKLFPSHWDWKSFWYITAFLSFVLAFMNLLPIPGLDGGHIVFVLYEMFSGRKPAVKVMEYAQMAGMVILFSLLLYANGLDVWRAIKTAL